MVSFPFPFFGVVFALLKQKSPDLQTAPCCNGNTLKAEFSDLT